MLTVSVVTRSPADPVGEAVWPIRAFYSPDTFVYPANPTITNACGYWGALISSIMFDAVGIATALVIGAGGGIATALLVRGRIHAPVLRSLGGTIVIIGASTAAAMLPIQIEGLPVVGGGGCLGAMTSTWLLPHFAPAGAWILTLTLLAVGMLLTTDYALLYAGKVIVTKSAKVSKSGMQRAAGALPGPRRRRRPFTDLEEPIAIEGEEEEYEGVEGEDEVEDEGEPVEPTRTEPTIKFVVR